MVSNTKRQPRPIYYYHFKARLQINRNMSSSKVSLKLLIHKPSRKILFGEADKNFIDFLFAILALPVATIFNLVSTESTVGPLRNLFQSLQNLNIQYFQEKYQNNINFLLKPKVQIPQSDISTISQLLPIESSLPWGIYKCCSSYCQAYYATSSSLKCPGCGSYPLKSLQLVPSSPKDELMRESMLLDGSIGCVKDKVSYMVMDDLTVNPMSAMSTISMLAQFGVDDATLIEEKLVYLDTQEGLNLLKASICSSSTVLSDVFLHNIDFQDSSTVLEQQEVVSDAKSFNLQL